LLHFGGSNNSWQVQIPELSHVSSTAPRPQLQSKQQPLVDLNEEKLEREKYQGMGLCLEFDIERMHNLYFINEQGRRKEGIQKEKGKMKIKENRGEKNRRLELRMKRRKKMKKRKER